MDSPCKNLQEPFVASFVGSFVGDKGQGERLDKARDKACDKACSIFCSSRRVGGTGETPVTTGASLFPAMGGVQGTIPARILQELFVASFVGNFVGDKGQGEQFDKARDKACDKACSIFCSSRRVGGTGETPVTTGFKGQSLQEPCKNSLSRALSGTLSATKGKENGSTKLATREGGDRQSEPILLCRELCRELCRRQGARRTARQSSRQSSRQSLGFKRLTFLSLVSPRQRELERSGCEQFFCARPVNGKIKSLNRRPRRPQRGWCGIFGVDFRVLDHLSSASMRSNGPSAIEKET